MLREGTGSTRLGAARLWRERIRKTASVRWARFRGDALHHMTSNLRIFLVIDHLKFNGTLAICATRSFDSSRNQHHLLRNIIAIQPDSPSTSRCPVADRQSIELSFELDRRTNDGSRLRVEVPQSSRHPTSAVMTLGRRHSPSSARFSQYLRRQKKAQNAAGQSSPWKPGNVPPSLYQVASSGLAFHGYFIVPLLVVITLHANLISISFSLDLFFRLPPLQSPASCPVSTCGSRHIQPVSECHFVICLTQGPVLPGDLNQVLSSLLSALCLESMQWMTVCTKRNTQHGQTDLCLLRGWSSAPIPQRLHNRKWKSRT